MKNKRLKIGALAVTCCLLASEALAYGFNLGAFFRAQDSPTLPPAGELYVHATNGDDSNTGSQTSPFKTIQKAIDIASGNTSIFIAQGIYTGNLILKTGVSLKGGYSASDWTQRNTQTFETRVNGTGTSGGGLQTPAATIVADNIQSIMEISGLTVDASNRRTAHGAGIRVYNSNTQGVSSVTILNCKIYGPSNGNHAMGVAVRDSYLNIQSSTIYSGTSNQGSSQVSGVSSYTGNLSTKSLLSIHDSQIYAQETPHESQGVYFLGPATISRNRISGGDGFISTGIGADGKATITNNIITSGSAEISSGLRLFDTGDAEGNPRVSSAHIQNNTIRAGASNTSTALYLDFKTTVKVYNNVLIAGSDTIAKCVQYANRPGATLTIRNNNLTKCNDKSLWNCAEGSCPANLEANGNESVPVFLDSSNKTLTTSHAYIKTGGLDINAMLGNSPSFTRAFDYILRTAGSSTKSGGQGWSMGAYELD